MIFIVLVWLLIFILIPHVAIACVNTLFETSIEHSLLNWACATLLIVIIRGSVYFKTE